jgi:hypothetical protein
VCSVAIVSVVWFTSTSWRRDRVFAPYTVCWRTRRMRHWPRWCGPDATAGVSVSPLPRADMLIFNSPPTAGTSPSPKSNLVLIDPT